MLGGGKDHVKLQRQTRQGQESLWCLGFMMSFCPVGTRLQRWTCLEPKYVLFQDVDLLEGGLSP